MPPEPALDEDLSAAERADLETSSEDYARRFAGPVGAWFLDVQARTTLDLLRGFSGASVLDVGGGHGQLARPLAGAGHPVTVFGSPLACGGTVRALADAGRVRFESGDLLKLPYADGAFDVVLSFRLLPHVGRWTALLGELCRVARRCVVVDYPTARSVNAVAGVFFGLKKGVEGNTRSFRVFRDAEVAGILRSHGFHPTARRAQFVLPMAFHRALGLAGASRTLEALAAGVGLRALLGSPVVLRGERRG